MISKKLIKSSFIYTIIGALPLLSAFFLLIFYTNYLTKTEYGALVIYISITAFFQILINLGLDTYIGISYFDARHDPEYIKSKIGLIAGYLLIWGFIVLLFTLLTGNNLFQLIFRGKDIFFYPYGLLSVATAFCNSFFKTFTNLLINQERPYLFAIVNMANFFMTIGFSLAGLFMFPYTLIGPMWGRFISGIGIFIIALIFFRKETIIRVRLGDELRQTLTFAFPVLIFFLLSWCISSIYPFIMKYFLDLQDIAIFGLAIQFTLLVEFVLNGLSSAIIPKVFGLIKSNELTGSTTELNKYFSGFNAISLLIIPASTFFIPLVLPLFINKDYESSFLFLSALNIGFASRGLYNYFLTPVYLFKKTKFLPRIYMITTTLQIILSIFMIRYFGIWGAVAANVFTKIVQILFLYLTSKRFFKFSFNQFKFIWLPLLIMIVIFISEYFVSKNNLHSIRFLQMLFTYILVYFFYRNEFLVMIKGFALKFKPKTKEIN